MSKLRLIQCGVGGFGEGWAVNHVLHSPDFEIAAIVDLSSAALEKTGGLCQVPAERRFGSLEEALERVEADAVLSVTPPTVHPAHARLALARGLHFLTEKPIADTMENALAMIRLADEAGKQLVVSQQYRFRPSTRKLRELVGAKSIGEIGHGHVDFYMPADFTGTFREKMEFPLLIDMAIHHVDLIRSITGRDVVRVTAQSFQPAWSWYGHDAGLKMLLEMEGGIPISYSGDWSALGRTTSWNGTWRLQGAEGSLHLEDDRLFAARCERWGKNPSLQEIATPPLALSEQSAVLHGFAEAIHTGTPAETSGRNNLNSFATLIAAMHSAQGGGTVAVHRGESN
jgi:predicted dehydrogenase